MGQFSLMYIMSLVNLRIKPRQTCQHLHIHAGHTRKASRISKAAVDNCGKGVGNLYLSYQKILVRYMHLCIISNVSIQFIAVFLSNSIFIHFSRCHESSS